MLGLVLLGLYLIFSLQFFMFTLSFIERVLDHVAAERSLTDQPAISSNRVDSATRTSTERPVSSSSTADPSSSRDDCTVLVQGLHPSTDEFEIYEFFSKESGKVRDVQIVKDPKTRVSRGVAYVEFYLSDSVLRALACNGQLLAGRPIRVQSSMADRNRAAEVAKAAIAREQEKPATLYVCGLVDDLRQVNENDLTEVFGCFGSVQGVRIGRCPYNGDSLGYAYVKFRRAADAREAMLCMHVYNWGGHTIQVGYVAGEEGTGLDYFKEATLGRDARQRIMDGLMKGGGEDGDRAGDSVVKLRYAFDGKSARKRLIREVEDDAWDACKKFGKPLKMRSTPEGTVFVKFETEREASAARKGLDGVKFDLKPVEAELVDVKEWPEAF